MAATGVLVVLRCQLTTPHFFHILLNRILISGARLTTSRRNLPERRSPCRRLSSRHCARTGEGRPGETPRGQGLARPRSHIPSHGQLQALGHAAIPSHCRQLSVSSRARRAGIGHVRPHDLRHTCASLLISQDVNIKQVSSHLRHSSVSITMDTYGHLYPADRSKIVDTMDRVLGVAANG